MKGWHGCVMHTILKQKWYNFTTNTLKAYLGARPSSLSAFMISKTHIVAQTPCGRQLNAKVCSSESVIFPILSILSYDHFMFNNDISKMVQVLSVILARNCCLSQRGAL